MDIWERLNEWILECKAEGLTKGQIAKSFGYGGNKHCAMSSMWDMIKNKQIPMNEIRDKIKFHTQGEIDFQQYAKNLKKNK